MSQATLRSVALRVAALAMLLLLVIVAVLAVRTMNRLPDATLYWIRSDATSFSLAPRSRRLGSRTPEAYAQVAVAALAAGPNPAEQAAGLSSAVPPGTEVLDAELRDGTLRIELSPAFVAGGGTASMRGRFEQLVWTLTQPSWSDAVSLWVDGVPLRVLGGEGLMVPARWVRPVDGTLPTW